MLALNNVSIKESPDYNNQKGGFIDYDTKNYYRTH